MLIYPSKQMSEKLASAGLMVLFPILSPEEINLITVKEQRISDKFKKKKSTIVGKYLLQVQLAL